MKDKVKIQKRGGYSGSKPASSMGPPPKAPSVSVKFKEKVHVGKHAFVCGPFSGYRQTSGGWMLSFWRLSIFWNGKGKQ